MDKTKTCNKCNRELPENKDYFRLKGRWLGNKCRICEREDAKLYYDQNKDYFKEWHEKNKEFRNKKARENREKNKEIYTERALKWQKENKERAYAINKKWRNKEENKEKKRKLNANWMKKNPDKNAQNTRRQEARKAKLPYTFAIEEWNLCKAYFENKCSYCGSYSEKLHQEHFVPVVKGGGYTKQNILPACQWCNTSKGQKKFFEWYYKQAFYSKEREKRVLDYLEMQSDGG